MTWFTTMLGKKASLKQLKRLLIKKYGERDLCLAETTFVQGRQSRWGLAWTFDRAAKIIYQRARRSKLEKKAHTKKNISWKLNDTPQGEVFARLEKLTKSYGIKTSSENRAVLTADEEVNGFGFSITAFTNGKGSLVELYFKGGDQDLYNG